PASDFALTAAGQVASEIRKLQANPDKQVTIVFATGNTMVGFLDNLAKEKNIDWARVQAFHLDEYKGLPTDHPASFAYFLNKNLFSKVALPKENIHYVNGAKPDLAAYIEKLKSFGGADIVMLGVGLDGHLAFNEPPAYSRFDSHMQEVSLTPSTIEANKADYLEIVNNPYAYTMGMADIFEGKHLFFLANKATKAEIVKKSLEGPVTEDVPASILQKHPNVTVVLDNEAATMLENISWGKEIFSNAALATDVAFPDTETMDSLEKRIAPAHIESQSTKIDDKVAGIGGRLPHPVTFALSTAASPSTRLRSLRTATLRSASPSTRLHSLRTATLRSASPAASSLTIISDFSDTIAQPTRGGDVPAFEETLRHMVAEDIGDEQKRAAFKKEAESAYMQAQAIKWDGNKDTFMLRAQTWLKPFVAKLSKQHIEKLVKTLTVNSNFIKAIGLIRKAAGLAPDADVTITIASGTLSEIIDSFIAQQASSFFTQKDSEEAISFSWHAIPALAWDKEGYYTGDFTEEAHAYAYQGVEAYPQNSIVLGDNRMEQAGLGLGKQLFNLQKEINVEEFKKKVFTLNLNSQFNLPLPAVHSMVSSFISDMHKGLAGQPSASGKDGLGGQESSLAMLPTFVDNPTGKEQGKFLALDLGGTNFRVLLLDLKADGSEPSMIIEKFKLTKEHITTTQEVLFDAIASFVKQFLTKHNLTDTYNLGFTFSFPVEQTNIDEGLSVKMSKGFTVKGIVGKDVVTLLRKAFTRQGVTNVNVAAIDNDTTGTQVARAYMDTNTSLGVILGTGTNICVRLPMEMITKEFSNKDKYKASHMIVNMESGNFNKHLPMTEYDTLLDSQSTNPGEHWEEKMVSGLYLGELMRLTLRDLISKGILFKGRLASNAVLAGGRRLASNAVLAGGRGSAWILNKTMRLETKHISDIEALDLTKTINLWKLRWMFKKLFITRHDASLIQEVAHLIATRSARVAATVIAASIMAIDPELTQPHTVAVDGTVFEKHYQYQDRMREVFTELFGEKASQIKLQLTHDGSGVGAGIIAAVAADQGRGRAIAQERAHPRNTILARGVKSEREPLAQATSQEQKVSIR
ncbi:MAG: 6-phosphogluconolactonase, partial [Candidatus Omnitrophica bacterium]|nr:6-phosphogluconolactonase [Candidatus Omnitrophota bacterium]